MKNLQVVKNPKISFDVEVISYCIDVDNKTLYVLTNSYQLLSTKLLGRNYTIIETILDLEDKVQEELTKPSNEIILLEFIVELGSILIICKNGYLIQEAVSSFSPPSRIIKRHHRLIEAAKLSPSQDLIAFADENNDLYLITIDGAQLYHVNALTQNESLHRPVGVGWGSRETQFFGLDGRLSAEEQARPLIHLSDFELEWIETIEASEAFSKFRRSQNKATRIDWRGDGQYLATLTYLEDLDRNCFKIWNRKLELQYKSESLISVERGMMCWMPNGKYLCLAQRRDKVINEIAMFEKNGMVRHRLTLPIMPKCDGQVVKYSYVKDLTWSPDSMILAIVLKSFPGGGETLMLYTMQNFHYYLKFYSNLDETRPGLNCFLRWDPVYHNRFHIVDDIGYYREYICCPSVAYSADNSTVAVVDGIQILLTPFDQCTLPPPASPIVLKTQIPITNLAINPHSAQNLVFASGGFLHFTKKKPRHLESTNNEMFGDVKFFMANQHTKDLFDLQICKSSYKEEYGHWQNMTMISENRIAVSHNSYTKCEVYSYVVTDNTSCPEYVKQLGKWPNMKVAYIVYDVSKQPNYLFILFNNGCCSCVSIHGPANKSANQIRGKHLFKIEKDTTDSHLDYYYSDASLIKSSSSKLGVAVMSLSLDFNLRLNAKVIVPNCCTSFRLTENYLIYTTTDNAMHFVLLERLHSTNVSPTESFSQPLESGGTLVVASEAHAKVILQMPIGNLDRLHPRVLIFSKLTKLLDEQKYFKALKLAQKNRLDTNFIVDYLIRSSGSLDVVNKLAIEVGKQDSALLNLLITHLENCDTIVERYRDIMEHLPLRGMRSFSLNSTEVSDKINQVCSIIKLPDDIRYIQPKLLTLIRMNPKRVEEALHIVHTLGRQSQTDAFKFMLYFIDIDTLFREALCTYDTDIALMVAAASNKDPKEYLSVLDRFNKIDKEAMRRYEIDMYTKRYDRALSNLISLIPTINIVPHPALELILDLVKTKRLYKEAILTLNPKPKDLPVPFYDEIWSAYGKYLFEKRHYLEAASAFTKAYENRVHNSEVHLNNALKSYQLIDEWKRSLALIDKSEFDNSKKRSLIEKISNQLVERSRLFEAMLVFSQSKGEISPKLLREMLGKGDWYLADYFQPTIEKLFSKDDFATSISNFVSTRCAEWSRELDIVESQFARLKQLLVSRRDRKETADLHQDQLTSDGLSTIDGTESLSDVSGLDPRRVARSGAPSIKTRASSKTAKSQANKKRRINLRTGSRHEDVAIVLELKKFLAKQKLDQEEAMSLCAALFDYCELRLAKGAADMINGLISKMFKLANEISEALWPQVGQEEQSYSLYERFSDVMAPSDKQFENVDFEVLLKPDLPKELVIFDFV